jgi:16S rRNA (cytidine1402-2'-O)-methyltransferase
LTGEVIVSLWLVATPIGTLSDLSPRARQVLSGADLIAAEDTRVLRKLLSALNISAPPIMALHAHNEQKVAERVVEQAQHNEVVLVSDAGTPGISDPGRIVVEQCHRAGVVLQSVPGPSALTTALAVSGFSILPVTFLGFAPRKSRDGFARQSLMRGETLVIFEAPTRLADLVGRLAALQPEREACMCRELSKKHEEVLRKPLAELAQLLGERERVRGECVLVVGPGHPLEPEQVEIDGQGVRAIAQALSRRWGTSRQVAYKRLVEWEEALGDSEAQ